MSRDDFSARVKDVLSRQVGSKCSLCGCETTASHSEDATKSVSIGMAAHITAASEGGPRYDPTLTPEQRSSADNGIWTCENHGKLIAADDSRFPVKALRSLKARAGASGQPAG